MIDAGPTHPTRQPIMRNSFDAEPTVMVASANASPAGLGVESGAPSRRRDDPQANRSTAGDASQCSCRSTSPVGIARDIVALRVGADRCHQLGRVDVPAIGPGRALTTVDARLRDDAVDRPA
jgi:hypothetical protein